MKRHMQIALFQQDDKKSSGGGFACLSVVANDGHAMEVNWEQLCKASFVAGVFWF